MKSKCARRFLEILWSWCYLHACHVVFYEPVPSQWSTLLLLMLLLFFRRKIGISWDPNIQKIRKKTYLAKNKQKKGTFWISWDANIPKIREKKKRISRKTNKPAGVHTTRVRVWQISGSMSPKRCGHRMDIGCLTQQVWGDTYVPYLLISMLERMTNVSGWALW